MRLRSLWAPGFLLLLTGCSGPPKPIEIEKFLQDFIGTDLALSPVSATETGFHSYQGVALDDILDDYGKRGVDGLRMFYNSMHTDAKKMDSPKLPAETRADLELIRQYCEAQLLDLDRIQTYKHNPTMYVELIGRAVYGPATLNYAPLDRRMRNIVSRLNKVPAFLETAKANLTDAPEIWNKVAQAEGEGDVDLIDKQVRAQVPPSLEKDYDGAAAKAIAAIRSFNDWLKNTLSGHVRDWRLGRDLYAEKFKYALANGQTPEQTLASAEQKLNEIRFHMEQESKQLWPKYFPGKPVPNDLNATVSAVLNKIAQDHTTPDKFFDNAKRDLAEATQFVKEHGLVPLPKLDNLQVIPTPEFMRGIYGVGGFDPAPALQPELGAFYWITPFTPDMKPEDVESKLREYNAYHLKLLTVHEAMPGHWLQAQYANEVLPRSRGVLRQMLSSNPYVEGWAVYAEQLLTDEGYQPVPEMRLTFEKEMLRVMANAILDVKMQTQGMTDEQALDLMMNRTFQERQEAVLKVRRAKLTSCQLPTYFAGWQAWLRVRDTYKQKKGSSFSLSDFHARALKEGAVPMPILERLLIQ
jgi:uncharacterized protein (DUF885 family)